MSSDPADPNAPTRTVLPAGSDAATGDGGDPDRTRSSGDQTRASAIAGTPRSGADKARRPAPLQYRDPDRYEVIAEHGRGGLGRVMRARDKELGRPVAIKEMLHPGLTSELRFFREALITARLEHPGIVPVHEAGRWPDGTPFYAMKLVAGRPLKALIDEATSLDQRLALLPHVIAVCDAIAYAHSRGIIHRDLKPSNVIVGDFGETVVIDWGLAKDIADPDDPSSPAEPSSAPGLTTAGTVLGTPGYMPPEQATGAADTRSDVYSIGALLAHVLHGRAPDGASGSIGAASPGPPAKIPPALLAIVAKATAVDPPSRYETARAMGDDLRHHQHGRLVTAHRYSLAQLVHHWALRNRTLVIISAAAVLVLVAAIAASSVRIVRERDRAEASRRTAVASQQSLILAQARGALETDPSKAMLWIRTYKGSDQQQAQDIAAEAIGRGVARFTVGTTGRVSGLHRGEANTFYSISGDSTLRQWQVVTNRLEETVLDTAVTDSGVLAYLSGSGSLVHASHDSALVLRARNKPPRELYRGKDVPSGAWFSRDGSQLLITGDAGTITVVDVDTGSVLLEATLKDVSAVGFQEHGVRAVTSSAIHSWNLPTRAQAVKTTTRPAVDSVVLDSGRVASLRDNGTVEISDNDLVTVRTIPVKPGCKELSVAPDEQTLAVQCDVSLVLLSATDGRVLLERRKALPYYLAKFSSDSDWLVAANLDRTITLISTRHSAARELRGHASGIVTAVEFVGDYVVTADESGNIRLWPLNVPWAQVTLTNGDLRRVVASPDSRYFATDSSAGVVRLWSEDGRLVREYQGHDGVIPGLTFSADSRFIVTPGWDRKVGIWPVDAGGGRTIEDHKSEVMAVAPFQQGVASASMDGEIRLWDLDAATSRVLHRATKRPYYLSATDVLVASGGLDGTVHEYDVRSSSTRLVHNRGGSVIAVRYSRDGSRLVSAFVDGHVYVTEVETRVSRELSLGSAVTAVAISTDSQLLAVATDDGTLRTFEIDSLLERSRHRVRVKRMSFATAGRILVATCYNGMAMVWDMSADTTAAVYLGEDAPVGIAASSDGASIVATTNHTLTRFSVRDLVALPIDASGRLQNMSVTPWYQLPNSVPEEEEMLFDVED